MRALAPRVVDPGRGGGAAARDPDRPAGPGHRAASTSSRTSSATSGWGCCSSSPATRSTSSGSGAGRCELGGARLGAVAGARLRARRRARRGGRRAVVPVHGLGAGDDGDRHADPDPARRGRAAHALRHLPARRRRGRRVRPDPADHARARDRPAGRGGRDPRRLRRPVGGDVPDRDALDVARLGAARAHVRVEQPARDPARRRARVRARRARRGARARPAARRLRRRA